MSVMSSMLGGFFSEGVAHSSQKDAGTRYREQDGQRWQEILDQAHSVAAADEAAPGQQDADEALGRASKLSPTSLSRWPARMPGPSLLVQPGMAAAEWDAAVPAAGASAVASLASGMTSGPTPAHPTSDGEAQLEGGLRGSHASGGARAWALHEQLLKATQAQARHNAPLSAHWTSEPSQGWQLHLRARGLDPSQAWTLAHVLRAGHAAAAAAPLTRLVCNGEVVYDHAAQPVTDTVFTG